MAEKAHNPFVGPRPFEAGDRERFFGRDIEVRQLASLIIARRVVVLYARSGAGKTSLLRAGLIPFLEEDKGLDVLPIVRVRGEPNEDTRSNVYTRRALQSLMGDADGDRVADSEELAELSFSEGLDRYLASRPTSRAKRPSLLIVDQFEELFRTHSAFHDQRAEFFRQLATCLSEHPYLSLLLSLREDAVAELDPFAALLPDRLRVRLRLELLGETAALEAMRQPAFRAGLELDKAKALRLVDELRTVRIQRPDGGSQEILGPTVEPVQLQVVCHRLWQEHVESVGETEGPVRLAPEGDWAMGSVDAVLIGYYDEQVAAVARLSRFGERAIRDWFDGHLITEHGMRGQVLRGVDSTEDLPNTVVEALVDARLVRSEKRRGATWYELAHDRLLKPIQTSNTVWRQQHLRPMQRRAELWARQGRPRGLLLSSGELRRELAWAETENEGLTPAEEDLLAASRRARRTRRLIGLALFVTLLLAGSLWRLWLEQEYRQREQARGLAAHARSRLDEQLDLSLLLSLEAHRIDPRSAEARDSLLTALQYQPRLLTALEHQAVVWSVAYGPARADAMALLASGDADGRVMIWDTDRRQPLNPGGEAHQDMVLSLTFSRDGRYLLSTGRDGKVLLWDLTREPLSARALRHAVLVTGAAFDPRDSDRLFTGDTEGGISIWDLSEDPPPRLPVGEHEGWVTSLTADPSGSGRVASGGVDHRVQLWHPDRSVGKPERTLSGHEGWIAGLAWDPTGRILSSASLDGRFGVGTSMAVTTCHCSAPPRIA